MGTVVPGAASCTGTIMQCGDNAERAVHAGHEVTGGHAHPRRMVGVGSSQAHQPGLALGDLVVTGPAAFGAVVAEAGNGEGD